MVHNLPILARYHSGLTLKPSRISFIMLPLYFIFWISSVIFSRMAANEYKETTDVLNEITSAEKYSKFLRPFHKGSPLKVAIGITVIHFVAVREVEEQFSLDMITWQTWNDPRLHHSLDDPITLPGESRKVIWLPDTFFLNVRTATIHDVIAENSKVSITPGGVVTYSTRLTITAGCSMDLADYPLDEQYCDLELSTYAYTTNQLVYTWINGSETEKIRVSDEHLSEFTLVQTQSLYGFETYADGNHSKLIARFWFKRRIGYAFLQIYFPTMMLVVLSWLVFWIPQDAVPARIALGSTTVLSVVTFTGSFRSTFPKVSYIKAVDVYFIVSFVFVFSALMEYILVLLDTGGVIHQRVLHDRNNVENCRNDVSFIEDKHHIEVSELHDVKVERPVEHPVARSQGKSMTVLKGKAKKAKEYAQCASVRNEASTFDRVSRYLFPCSYCIFNLIYWCYYGLASFGYEVPTK